MGVGMWLSGALGVYVMSREPLPADGVPDRLSVILGAFFLLAFLVGLLTAAYGIKPSEKADKSDFLVVGLIWFASWLLCVFWLAYELRRAVARILREESHSFLVPDLILLFLGTLLVSWLGFRMVGGIRCAITNARSHGSP